jgi:hypothetical protein
MIRSFLLLCFFSLFVSPFAGATITITSISGVSSYTTDITAGITILAGLNGVCSSSTSSTCNSCESPGDSKAGSACTTPGGANCCGNHDCFTCNTATVTDNTYLYLHFTSNSVTTGTPVLKTTDGSKSFTSLSGVGTGSTFTFSTTWNNVCQMVAGCDCSAVTSGGTCSGFSNSKAQQNLVISVGDGSAEDSATLNFKVLYQANATSGTFGAANKGSLASFKVYPGDEKVYIEDPQPTTGDSFPNTGAGLIKQIYFFVGAGNFTNAYYPNLSTGNTYSAAPLSVDSEGGLDQIIDGLENDIYFFFRPASVDEAGNVFNIMDDQYIIDSGCNLTAADGGTNCPYAAKPSRVLGLLTEDMNCFVTTAAYGSNLDRHIDTFRTFRNHVLIQTPFGKKLIMSYYKYGPKMAQTLVDHQWLRPLARTVLWPAWGLTTLSLYFHLNLWQSFTLLFGVVFSGLFLFVFAFYRWSSKKGEVVS